MQRSRSSRSSLGHDVVFVLVVLLDLREHQVRARELELLNRALHGHEVAAGEARLQHEAPRDLQTPALILGQVADAAGPSVHLRERRIWAELPLRALPGRKAQREPRGGLGALGLQLLRPHFPLLLQGAPRGLVALLGLARHSLLLLLPSEGLLRLTLLLPLLLDAFAVHLQGLLVLPVLLLAQTPVLDVLGATSHHLRMVALHLLSARGQKSNRRVRLNLALQRPKNTDLVEARREEHAEEWILPCMDHLRYLV
mmetsp:Transcript_64223/g.184570  ORF Transcript_64223/g.184570 Transcript_64223/m.184570 type:complete len:255 (+) Transcript_64223:156-920(+)